MASVRNLARKPLTWVVVGVVVVVVGVGLALTQPWRLFIDRTVDEAFPVATTGTGPTPEAPVPDGGEPSGPASEPAFTELASGEFISLDHGTSGTALTVELADGSRYLRIEDLDTDNGPDLFVYLSTNAPDGPEGDFTADFVDLGTLKGNVGNQNYEIPADLDLSKYSSVVIWCKRFSSAFGAAPLTPA